MYTPPGSQRSTQLVRAQHHYMDTDTRKLVNHPSSSLESPTPIRFHWTCSPCGHRKADVICFYNVLYQLRTFIPCSWPSLLVSDGPASHLLQVFQSWLVFCGQPIGHKCFQPVSSNLLLTYFDMCIGNGILRIVNCILGRFETSWVLTYRGLTCDLLCNF